MNLSLTAKLIYSILLERAFLSKKNGWIDEQGQIYVIFPIANIAETIHKGITVVKDSLKELETAGLIERKRNYSAPNAIYVKLPNSRETGPGTAGKAAITEPEKRPCNSRKTGKSTAGKAAPSNKNIVTRDSNKPLPTKSSKQFSPPTLEDVKNCFFEKGGTSVQAERFYSYYESNGWKVGRNPMQNWKAAVAGWLARDKEYQFSREKSEQRERKFEALT